MSTEQNKANVRRLLTETFKDAHVAAELIHPSYVNHDFPIPQPGVEGFKAGIGVFTAAFPDIQVVVEDEIAEGNKVVSRGRFTGTHQGEFMGVPATGKSINVKYIDIWTVEGDKLKENWVQMDMLGLMQQIGVIPVAG